MQYKTTDIASRCSNLVRVNIYKDSIKNADKLPPLPGLSALYAMLEPAYSSLHNVQKEAAHSRPTTMTTEPERHAADEFIKVKAFVLWNQKRNIDNGKSPKNGKKLFPLAYRERLSPKTLLCILWRCHKKGDF